MSTFYTSDHLNQKGMSTSESQQTKLHVFGILLDLSLGNTDQTTEEGRFVSLTTSTCVILFAFLKSSSGRVEYHVDMFSMSSVYLNSLSF